MAKIGLPKGSGKRLKVREKSVNFEMDIEWQPLKCCLYVSETTKHESFWCDEYQIVAHQSLCGTL